MCQPFGYVAFCGKHVLKGLEVVFLLNLRRRNKEHAGRIQPATEADSNQVQDSVLDR